MSDGKQIFRPEALERLSSPEQLDELMVVTDSKAWIALAAIGIGLAIALLWSVVGSVPASIHGSGLLLREGGIYEIQAGGTGQIISLAAEEDSVVGEGEIVGYIAQPDLATRISLQHQNLLVLRANRETLVEAEGRNLGIALDIIVQDSIRMENDIRTAQGQIAQLEQRLEDTRFARQQGLVTGQAVSQVEQELASARSRLAQLRSALTGIPSRRIRAVQEHDSAVERIQNEVRASVQDSILLAQQLSEANEIRSPHRGRITQVMVDEGQTVATGSVVASLELLDRPLQAVIFVPVVGAKAGQGMTAHVQPLTVNWEEYGYIEGEVEFVSLTPVTMERINRVIKNRAQAQQMVQGADPYLVEISLNRADTPTGFQWTSGTGPDSTVNIHSGILAQAKIIVDTRRPITLVIPALRKFLGF